MSEEKDSLIRVSSTASARIPTETPVRLLMIRSLYYLTSDTAGHPLFAVLATTILLILLYLPRNFFPILLSPVTISTLALLATLLHFGSSTSSNPPGFEPTCCAKLGTDEAMASACTVPEATDVQSAFVVVGNSQKAVSPDRFLDTWCRRGPLEIIYEEEYEEGEEYDAEEDLRGARPPDSLPEHPDCISYDGALHRSMAICCFTDSDSESDCSVVSPVMSGWNDSPENLCFRWGDDDDFGEEMIEISLDEENLIEIDLSACR